MLKHPFPSFHLAQIDLAGAWTDTPPQAYEFIYISYKDLWQGQCMLDTVMSLECLP